MTEKWQDGPSEDEARDRLVQMWWHVVLHHGIDGQSGVIRIPQCKFCDATLTPWLAYCKVCGHPVWRVTKIEPEAKDRRRATLPLDDLGPKEVFGPDHPFWKPPVKNQGEGEP